MYEKENIIRIGNWIVSGWYGWRGQCINIIQHDDGTGEIAGTGTGTTSWGN